MTLRALPDVECPRSSPYAPSHSTLFRNRRLNDWVGNWLWAYPIWSDTHPYRPYHLQHQARTGTPHDPDLGLVAPFPITSTSLRRKIWRDLSGQTGWKFARAAAARSLGRYRSDPVARRAAPGVVITNLVPLGILTAAGHPLRFHRMLEERGVLDGTCTERGYLDVLRHTASKPEESPRAARSEGGTDSDTVPTRRMPPF